MQPLHADPEQLFLASRTFWQANYQALDQLFSLRAAILRLEMTWSSDRADDFIAEIQSILQQLSARAEELFSMGLTLSRQADLWAEADQRWTGIYRDFTSNPPGE